VAEHMGLKGIGYETALRFTNKFLMRESLRASLPEYVPEFHFFDKTQDAETFCGKVSSIGEYVVKPINSQGSKGVRRLNSTNCFEIISNAFLESNSRGILIEKFIKGFEYSVEAYKEGDIIYNLAVTKKYHYDSNDCIDARNTWLGDISPELERMLFDANKQIIEKLGLPFGITHAEFKVNEGKPYLIEIAARGGGGSISNKIIPYLTGFHPAKALFAHLIGLNQQITVEDYKEKYAVLKFFNFREGKINKIHINKSAVQDLLEFHLDIKEGGIVRPIWDSRDRPGYFVLTGTDRSQVITREKWIEESVAIEYEKK
jgi:biotin carboxylase